MKSMFEYMGTIVVTMLISFIFVSFLSIEIQEINARNYHTAIIEDIQYKGNYSKTVNNDYGKNVTLTLNGDGTIKVTYHYNISAPIIGSIEANDIVGYAR